MKFEHILFPVDFSGRTQLLNAEVERLANYFGSRVTLLHVFEIPTAWCGSSDAPLITAESFTAFLDTAKQRLKNYPIQIPENRLQRLVAEGDPGWTITSWAAENNVDLVMMGTHGYGRVRGLLLGSVTAKVIHDAHCPVWTDSTHHAPADGSKSSISTILCAVDADDEAAPLLRTAAQLAKAFDAVVHVLHTVPGPESRPGKYLVQNFDWTDFYERWAGGSYLEFFRKSVDRAAEPTGPSLTENHRARIVVFVVYEERGGNHYDRLRPDRSARRLIKRLEQIGFQVTVQRPDSQVAACRRFEPGPCRAILAANVARLRTRGQVLAQQPLGSIGREYLGVDLISPSQSTPMASTYHAWRSDVSNCAMRPVVESNGPNSVRIKVDKFLFLFGSPGTPDGMNVSTGTVSLKDENNFKASGLVEVYSTSGQEVLTIPFTSEGQRVTLP